MTSASTKLGLDGSTVVLVDNDIIIVVGLLLIATRCGPPT